MNFSADDIIDTPPKVNLDAPLKELRAELSDIASEIEDLEDLIRGSQDKLTEWREVYDKVEDKISDLEMKEGTDDLEMEEEEEADAA
jgi:peptidoglycan hydrolase CwlO-like protein